MESADLLVAGPTHIRGMTSNFSRKLGISGEEKAKKKGSRPTTWIRMLKDLGLRECGRLVRTAARRRNRAGKHRGAQLVWAGVS